MAGIVRRLTVNQIGGSRVGLIFYADSAYIWGNLTSYNSAQEAADALNQMGYLDVIKLDIKTYSLVDSKRNYFFTLLVLVKHCFVFVKTLFDFDIDKATACVVFAPL